MKLRFSTSQNTRYVLSILGLLFIATAGYAGYIIYNNDHNHGGSNIFASLMGKNKPKVTTKSPEAKQIIALNEQENVKAAVVKPEIIVKNNQKLLVIDFYSDYLANKKSGTSQAATLAKYGTAKLAAEYSANQPGYDSLTCSSTDINLPISAAITATVPNGDFVNYAVDLSDSKSVVSSSQALVLGQGSDSKIDSIACIGSI